MCQEDDTDFGTMAIDVRNRCTVLLSTIEEKEPDEIANEAKCIYMETAQKHLRKRVTHWKRSNIEKKQKEHLGLIQITT